MFSNHLYAFHAALTPSGETVLPPEKFLHNWSTDEIDEMVFGQSDTDMLVAMPLPLTDLYSDGLSAWESCAELARKRPDRTVFWGSVNPLEGKKALDLMEVQVKEYGAKATFATTTASPSPGGWTTPRWHSRSSRRPGSWE